MKNGVSENNALVVKKAMSSRYIDSLKHQGVFLFFSSHSIESNSLLKKNTPCEIVFEKFANITQLSTLPTLITGRTSYHTVTCLGMLIPMRKQTRIQAAPAACLVPTDSMGVTPIMIGS
jgi:hypothetical protein